MGVLSLVMDYPGQVGLKPRRGKMVTTDNLATITAAGYLNNFNLLSVSLEPTDIIDVTYSYNPSTNSGVDDQMTVSISNGIITLVEFIDLGNVVLPVVNGHFANFSGTTGKIADLGFLPSDASKTKVVMANGAVILNHIATYKDTSGTIGEDAATAINGGNIQAGLSGTAGQLASFPATAANGSFIFKAINNAGGFNSTLSNSNIGQASVYSLADPGVATTNLLMSDSAAGQTISTGGLDLSVGSVRALQGNFQAGSDGHAGTFTSFPGTTGNGSFVIAALNAGGAFTTTLKNSVMGQSSVVSIPDPGNAVGQLLVGASATPFVSGNLIKASGTAGLMVDQGVAMKSVAQAVVAGGNAAQTVTDAFCTTGSCVIANWNDTTNAVDIQKVAAGNGSFVVTSSADPGASHLNYVIFK